MVLEEISFCPWNTAHLNSNLQRGGPALLSLAVVVTEKTLVIAFVSMGEVDDDPTDTGVVVATTVKLVVMTVALVKVELLDTGVAVELTLLDVVGELVVEDDWLGAVLMPVVVFPGTACECVSWLQIDKNMTKTRWENVWFLRQFHRQWLTYCRATFDSTVAF